MIKLKQLLLNESVNGEELVASGMKKVFANAHETGAKTISYDQIEAVGLGYIKDVSTAQKVAYQCAVQIADKFGYWDDEANEQFAKNDGTGPVAEVGLNQSPKFGEEKDAVMDYLRMISNMPEDDVPPIHVWKEIVDSAGIALQNYIRGHGWSGLNENENRFQKWIDSMVNTVEETILESGETSMDSGEAYDVIKTNFRADSPSHELFNKACQAALTILKQKRKIE